LTSDFQRILRRLKPEKHRQQLKPRKESELAFLSPGSDKPRTLLYDTTVYIDVLQGRFPVTAEAMLRAVDAWHSTVTETELAAICALLDPGHPSTREVIAQITEILDRRSPYRTIAPDRQAWREAGILSGTLARLQGHSKADRRRILNDAVIFATARKCGHAVLTRNIVDFDYLQQLDPSGRVLFYTV
jgi:predicted nucleic acid-binding protein